MMAALSIRTRLTLWYMTVLLVVLVIASITVMTVHARLGMARVDAELAAAVEAVSGVVRHEIDERLTLADAASDMLEELSLPGVGVAVLSPSGSILSTTSAARPPLMSEQEIVGAGRRPDYSAGGMRKFAINDSYANISYTLVVWRSMDGLNEEARTLRESIWIGVPIALVLAGLGGWTIASRTLKPLGDLASQADAIDRGLDGVQLRVPNASDELGLFARAFNRLLARLATLLRAQRAFMADASHQLRTPVSVIRTSAQVTLTRSDRTAAEYQESLEIIARQSVRLTKMVDDMFMLAMVDAEGRPLQNAPLYLNEVIDGVARDAQPLAAERNMTVNSVVSDDIPLVGDEDLLRQMLWNLVENALRYGRNGGSIALATQRTNGFVSVTVEDDGPGIAPAERARVFDRFVRLETAGGAAGAGLGLPIARWIAEAHNGSLVLDESSSGCRFRIRLPSAD
jgi:signal transduction histidine kinase